MHLFTHQATVPGAGDSLDLSDREKTWASDTPKPPPPAAIIGHTTDRGVLQSVDRPNCGADVPLPTAQDRCFILPAPKQTSLYLEA